MVLRTVSGEAYVPLADFQVSADTVEYQSGLAFAKLGDGGFVALWYDSRYGTQSMRMQRFDANGSKVGGEIVIPDVGGASLAPSLDGGFLLTWTAEAPYPTSFEVRARFYDSNLVPAGPEFGVNTRTDGFQIAAGTVALAGGGYVVTWFQPEDQGFDHVRAQILDSAGNKIGGEIAVSEEGAGDKYAMDVVALAGGGFVATWLRWSEVDQNGFPSEGLRAQVFDSAGNKVGPAFTPHTIITGQQGNAVLEALPDGGFVAAWTDSGRDFFGASNGNQGVWLQRFDSLGQKVGAASRVGDPALSAIGAPTIAVTSAGFVVAWAQLAAPSGGVELRAQRFDFAGVKEASEFVVTDTGRAFASTSLVLDNGAIVIGWTDREQYADVRAKLLYPAQHGTEAADGYSGTDGRDFYFGHGGEDVLAGGGAGDGLSGGDGDDVLNGEQGDDILDGGAGSDVMTGGGGDDHYSVYDVGDVVNEDEGAGTDTVETNQVDYSAPAAVENVTGTLGAGTTQVLRGNALDNRLTGGDADNVFHIGSGGHDVVAGGGGSDTLIIDWSDSTSAVTSDIVNVPFGQGPGATHKDGTGRSVAYTRVENVILTTGSGNDSIATPGWLPSTGPVSSQVSSGAGDDVASLNSTLDSFDGGDGIDGVYAATDPTSEAFEWRIPTNLFVSPAGTPQLANIEYFVLGSTGSANDIVETGRLALPDRLYTGDGDDLILVYNGRDQVDASWGSDTLVIDWSDSTAPVQLGFDPRFFYSLFGQASSGTDRWVSFSDVERLILFAGSAADTIYAGNNADDIHGGGGDDILVGRIGDDLLDGGAGDDTLHGDSGDDTLRGGAGNDIFYVSDAGDRAEENEGEGIDEVRTSLASYSLSGTHIEKLRATNNSAHEFRGGSLANVLTGGGGNDFLLLQDGGEDSAFGGGGNDVIYFGTALSAGDVADGGNGRDAVVLQGNVTAVLTDTALVGIESLSIQSGANAFFGDTANNLYDYDVTTSDGNVAAGQQLIVNAQSLRAGEDFSFDGSAESDGKFLIYGGHGVDILTGGSGADVFFFEGQRWSSSDKVDGGAGRDSMVISAGSGLNRIEFVADSITNIESISLNNLFASDPSQKPSYELVLHNDNVAPGGTLIVNGNSIPLGQVVNVDGRAVQDGNLILFAGGGHDVLTGGAGADLIFGGGGADALTGGAGADTFRYDAATDSNAGLPDLIGDFQTGVDRIDLSRIDADTHAAGNQAFTWIGSSAFSGSGAASAGELRLFEQGGYQRIEGDTDGDGNADLLIVFQIGTAPVAQGDFLP